MKFVRHQGGRTTLATLAALLLSATFSPSTSHAAGTLGMSHSPSGLCQASSGFGAQYFYYGATYVENTTSSVQYLNCATPRLFDISQIAPGNLSGNLTFTNFTSSTVTVTCAAVVGFEGVFSGSFRVVSRSYSVAPSTDPGYPGVLGFSTTDLPAANEDSPLLFNCAMPPGIRLRSIYTTQPRNF